MCVHVQKVIWFVGKLTNLVEKWKLSEMMGLVMEVLRSSPLL